MILSNLPALVKNKAFLATVAVLGVGVFIYTRTGNTSGDSPALLNPAQINPELIALGINADLEKTKLNASREIALSAQNQETTLTQLNNATALSLANAEMQSKRDLAASGLKGLSIETNANLAALQMQGVVESKRIDASTTQNELTASTRLKELGLNFDLAIQQGVQSLKSLEITTAAQTIADTLNAEVERLKANLGYQSAINAQTNELIIAENAAKSAEKVADLQKDAAVQSAKASKSRGFTCCGFGISL